MRIFGSIPIASPTIRSSMPFSGRLSRLYQSLNELTKLAIYRPAVLSHRRGPVIFQERLLRSAETSISQRSLKLRSLAKRRCVSISSRSITASSRSIVSREMHSSVRKPLSLHGPSLSFGPDSSVAWRSSRGSRHSTSGGGLKNDAYPDLPPENWTGVKLEDSNLY
jgi:hypothetical protein